MALHGDVGSYIGARVVSLPLDATGNLTGGTDLGDAEAGGMMDFMTGWDDGSAAHGAPYEATFADDGRLFVANIVTGDILWIAPM